MTFDVGVVVPSVYGGDLVAGIERAAAAGADAVEFFDWEGADREAVVEACEANGVSLAGILSAGAGANIMETDSPAMVRPDDHEQCVADVERSIEAADAFGADALIVTVGQDQPGLDEATQSTAVVDVLRAVAPTAEAQDVTVVPELLNGRVDHPGYFLQRTARGVDVVNAVDSPNVGLLFDVYHQQITEGDVTRRLRTHLDHVGHVHVADNPGRAEPGTGELDYAHVFGALADAGYEGVVSCEFSPEADPDDAVAHVVELADAARGR